MKKLFCSKCKEVKDNFIYANKFNSTKFCPNCHAALEERNVENEEINSNDSFIYEALHNAVNKMFNE